MQKETFVDSPFLAPHQTITIFRPPEKQKLSSQNAAPAPIAPRHESYNPSAGTHHKSSRVFIAAPAIQHRAQARSTSLLGRHPLPNRPRRIMPYMLVMSALQLRHPVILFVAMKADDRTPHPDSTSLHLLH
jgi:hypothetical protein